MGGQRAKERPQDGRDLRPLVGGRKRSEMLAASSSAPLVTSTAPSAT
jgi:hypothetical protein